MVGCSPDDWVHLFLDHLTQLTMTQLLILQDCFSRYSDEMNTTHEGDILIDRGFRDVVNFLTINKKLHVYCAELGQLDTIEANTSRFVTKCRWVIEQVFGRFKKKNLFIMQL